LRGGFAALDQQVVDVGAQIWVDDEAGVGLAQIDPFDFQAPWVLVIETIELQPLPFDEVAIVDGIESVQLRGVDTTANVEGQWLDALQVDLQFAAEHAAA